MSLRTAFLAGLLALGAAIPSLADDNIDGQPATWWPGNQISGARQTPAVLDFRGDIKSFMSPGGEYWMSFEANLKGTTTSFNDGGNVTFLVSVADKATVAAILTAQTTGCGFRIQYVKDASFWNQPVLVIKNFLLAKP